MSLKIVLDVEVILNNRSLDYVEDDVELFQIIFSGVQFIGIIISLEKELYCEFCDLCKWVKYLKRCKDNMWKRWIIYGWDRVV